MPDPDPPYDADPTRRFTDRVDAYVKHRPGYPPELLDALRREANLGPGCRVADIGSGTGIFASLLLDAGCAVFAVEPNDAMRSAAEQALSHRPGFHSVAGSAEVTTLSDAGVDLVTAAQAFHWFDPQPARAEFARILRPGGMVALIWNLRPPDGSDFNRAYETMLETFGTDYDQVRARYPEHGPIAAFFAPQSCRQHHFPSVQVLDFEGLKGRLLSTSYAPAAGHPDHAPMLAELRRIFDAYAVEGRIRMEYDTRLYFGTLREGRAAR